MGPFEVLMLLWRDGEKNHTALTLVVYFTSARSKLKLKPKYKLLTIQEKTHQIKMNKQTNPQNGKESLSLLSRSHLMCSVFVTRETIYVLNNTVIWRGKNPSHLGNTTNFSAGKNQASGFLILDQTRLRSKSCNLAIPCSGDMAVRDVAVGM